VPLATGVSVEQVERSARGWIAHTLTGDAVHAQVLVWATGIVSNPQTPPIPTYPAFRQRGDQEHLHGRAAHRRADRT
jgi:cation diffusion facilitator CzcD-associated flavoprotein CzcO